VDEKGDFGERRSDLCGDTLIDVVLVYPVPDFTCPGPHTGMQAGSPEPLGLRTIKHAIGEVLAQIKLASAAAQTLDLPGQVFGLVLGPWHPRPQMLKAHINRRFEQ